MFIVGFIVQNLLKIGPNWVTKKKNRDIQKVKSRMENTQKLKLMDPETMDRWSYYSLCKNLCWAFVQRRGAS